MLLIFLALLAFYVAWNLGANDVANSMGTSVGSKAITLRQALAIAGILELSGAVLFGGRVSKTLATSIVEGDRFAETPYLLLAGMVSVMLACGIWLQIATSRGWPVASSHAVVGALAGFSAVAAGWGAVDWRTIATISIGWILTPAISAAIAACFYTLVKRWILDHPHPLQQLQEWIPWLSAALLGIFGAIVLPEIVEPLRQWLQVRFAIAIPAHNLPVFVGSVAAVSLCWVSWRQLDRLPETPADVSPDGESRFDSRIERQLARFQVLSACFVAFAHGSNDVGNAVAPLATIAYIRRTGFVPQGDFHVPVWVLLVGGLGIVAGLAVWGKKVIGTVGERIVALQPSSGFCAELATATTVSIASRLGLPVSTSHALVGGVIGIGLASDWRSIRWATLRGIFLAWLITVPIAAILGASIFSIVHLL